MIGGVNGGISVDKRFSVNNNNFRVEIMQQQSIDSLGPKTSLGHNNSVWNNNNQMN